MQLKKKILTVGLALCVLLMQVPLLTAFAEGGEKDVWIDNTVDESTSTVIGTVRHKHRGADFAAGLQQCRCSHLQHTAYNGS